MGDSGSEGVKHIDVFVSHSAKNAAIAHQISDALRASGLSTWIAPDDIPGGSSYAQEVAHALDASRTVLVLLTPEANASTHVAKEIDHAVSKGVTVIPVRLGDVRPSGNLELLLRLCQWVDLFPGSASERMGRLVHEVHQALGLIGEPTAPPRRERRVLPALAGVALIVALLAGLWHLVGTPKGSDAILTPANGALVTGDELANGTLDPSRGRTVFLVLRTFGPDRYYPQDPPPEVGWSGKWSGRVFFGEAGDGGRTFELLLVEAHDPSAIKTYLADAKVRGSWDGLASLPSDTAVLDSVTVTRR